MSSKKDKTKELKKLMQEAGIPIQLSDIKYIRTEKGNIIPNLENITRLLKEDDEFKDTLRWDDFAQKMEVNVNGKWLIYEDGMDLDYTRKISVNENAFNRVSKTLVFDAMMSVARDNRYDPILDWLKGLKWDKKPRLDFWIDKVYHTGQDEYTKSVGANWIMALVKRQDRPGAKFDQVLTIFGEQGIKKSTSLGIIGSPLPPKMMHIETTHDASDKDFFVNMQGNLIVEFSEGETLSRTAGKQLKSIISTAVDKYRAPYGRGTHDYPRRCVFAMTTNNEEFLKDETGNRRWLPIEAVGEADTDWLLENREQLYAEAYERVVRKNECYWEVPQDLLDQAHAKHQVVSANEESVIEWYENLPLSRKNEGITTLDAFKEVYAGEFGGSIMKKYEQMEIGNILRDGLGLKKVRRQEEGLRTYKYYPQNYIKNDENIEIDGVW